MKNDTLLRHRQMGDLAASWRMSQLVHFLRQCCRLIIGHEEFHLGRLVRTRVNGEGLTELRKLLREEPENRYVFVSERGAPLSQEGFLKMIKRAGIAAKLPFGVHPHMLRHACGYKLANDGHNTRAIQLYMGHKNIQNTVGYTQLSAHRFKNFWSD
jgi:integrase